MEPSCSLSAVVSLWQSCHVDIFGLLHARIVQLRLVVKAMLMICSTSLFRGSNITAEGLRSPKQRHLKLLGNQPGTFITLMPRSTGAEALRGVPLCSVIIYYWPIRHICITNSTGHGFYTMKLSVYMFSVFFVGLQSS